jgi:polygalacturonase
MARKAEPKNERYYSTRLIVASHADGLILYRIALHNSPNYHVTVAGTDGFTAWGVHLLTPTDRSQDARNTDGIDPGSSTNLTVAHSWIDNGDDNIAIKSGTTHMSVLDNHFYTGHGMSIGSETVGQAYLLVDGLTEDHTSSGIRIKSNVTRGGISPTATSACVAWPTRSRSRPTTRTRRPKDSSTRTTRETRFPTTKTS